MAKKYLIPSIILSVACAFNLNASNALDFSSVQTINPDAQTSSETVIKLDQNTTEPKVIHLNASDTFYSFTGATDKFVQCNVRASWADFKTAIENAEPNDFVYVSIANKMADMGLFDLATLAASKIQDKEISQLSIDDMKRFYYPARRLKFEDEMFLAEIYSNIIYNNQSSEATNELLKNTSLLSTSDYANYLVALGSYKSGILPRANQYIDIAIIQNPTNLNYQKLKAQILADGKTPADAIKAVDSLKKQDLYSYEYERKVKSLEQYVLYKTAKAEWEKNYHLGYYHYFENDNSKALRVLQTAASSKKGNNATVYGLMSEIYLKSYEFEKALDTAKKAYRMNSNNPKALLTLGDLHYRIKDYKQALKYYKQSASNDRAAYLPLVKEAQAYQQLSNTKKSKEIYTKVLKTHSDSFEAYYNIALLDADKKVIYLKKALAINPLFEDGWIELAKTELVKENFDSAKKCLSNAYYIDENDFRYYYYEGLLNKGLGDYNQAEYNFKKCLKLNPNFKDAQNELQTDPNVNVNQFKEIKVK